MGIHNKSALLADAGLIRYAETESFNTAERVGEMLVDIINAADTSFTESDVDTVTIVPGDSTVAIKVKQRGRSEVIGTMPAATTSAAGAMSSSDKVKLNFAYQATENLSTTLINMQNATTAAQNAADNAVIDSVTASAGASSVSVKVKQHGHSEVIGTIPAATNSSAGVMSSDDKVKLEDHDERLDNLERSLGEDGGIATLDENGQIPKEQQNMMTPSNSRVYWRVPPLLQEPVRRKAPTQTHRYSMCRL